MPKFDKKFVHFMWDDELEGKKCFVEDKIDELKLAVEEGNFNQFDNISNSTLVNAPFGAISNFWKFAYYDPYYDLKLAYEQGKTIQFHNYSGEWQDMYECEFLPGIEYRIKPDKLEEEKPVTHRELSRWLAQGRGEWRWYNVGDVTPYAQVAFHYCVDEGFLPVKKLVLVRKWDDDEWHEPTREYMGLNTQEV